MALQKQRDNQPKRALLDRRNELRAIESDYKEIVDLRREVENAQKQIADHTQRKADNLKAKTEVETTLLEDGKKWNAILQEEPDFRKQASAARMLDFQIERDNQSQKEINAQLETSQQEYDRKNKEFETTKHHIEHTQKELTQTGAWLEKNRNREVLSLKKEAIFLTLADLQRYRNEHVSVCKELTDITGELARLDAVGKTQNHSIETKRTLYAAKEEKRNGIAQKLGSLPIEEINRQKGECESKAALLNRLGMIWNTLYPLKKRIKENEDRLVLRSQAEEKNQNERIGLAKELDDLTIKIGQTEKIEEDLRIKISQSVEELRSMLHADEECPVCGSTEHPYTAAVNSQFHSMMNELSGELFRLKNQKEEWSKAFQKCEASTREYIIFRDDLNLQNEAIRTDIQKQEDDLSKLPEAEWFYDTAEENRSGEIEQRIEALRKENNRLTTLQQEYSQSVKEQEQLQRELDAEKKSLDALVSEKNGTDNRIELMKAEFGRGEKHKNELLESIRQRKDVLNSYFDSEDWWALWKEQQQAYIDRLKTDVEEWERNQQLYQELTNQLKQLGIKHDGDAAVLKTSGEQLEAIREKKTQADQTVANLRKERSLLFEGREVGMVEGEFEKRKKETGDNIEALKKRLQEISEAFSGLKAASEEIERAQSQRKERIAQSEQAVDAWLEQYNQRSTQSMDLAELQNLLSYSVVDLQQIEAETKRIESEVLQTRTVFETQEKGVAEHRNHQPDLSLNKDVLMQEKLDKIQTKTNLNDQLSLLKAKKMHHQDNEKMLNELISEAEKARMDYVNWSKLNELVGSAKGDKFKAFAQEFTLDVLLQNANIKMRDIAPRYKLTRIPNTLSLQITDKDMFNAVRSVYSLSGGETFLVSLALALGLSALSSKQMNIESMFIDEGFGSLDQETLATAMDALESLRTQGRKIGVITHVREMTERIPTRIQVSKKNNGASRITIEG